MEKEQQKALDGLMAEMKKKYGEGTISFFGKNTSKVKWVPVDSYYLTNVLGGKGLPRGRMIEIYGPESAGKTSLACYFVGQSQKYFYPETKRYGVGAYIDVEHALDPEYARSFGMDIDKMLFTQPDNAEQALNIAEDLLDSGLVDIIVIDSVAALCPQAEIDGEMGDSHMGLQARLMSQACRKLQAKMTEDSATVVFINQIRMKIGVMYGNPETTTGGNALKYYASVRLTVRKGDTIEGKGDDDAEGMECNVKCIKNKVGTPFRKVTMKIKYGFGYQVDEEYVMAMGQYDIIDRGGAGWYSITDLKGKVSKLQGLPKVIEFLKADPALYTDLKVKLFAAMKKACEKPTDAVAEAPSVNVTEAEIEQEAAAQEALEQEAFEETNPLSLAAMAGAETIPEETPAEVKDPPLSEKVDKIEKKGKRSMLTVTEADLKEVAGSKKR